MNQAVYVGRIVHYQSYGTADGKYKSLPRAAIITEIPDTSNAENPSVGLCILNPTGQFFTQNVQYSREPKSGCWNFPGVN